MDQKVDYIFKIILIGSQNVGKSSLMARYVDAIFPETYLATVGVDFKIKTIQVKEKNIKMQIWDTAGQERFQALTQSHYRGSHGCIAVFDVSLEKSFQDAKTFLKLVIEEYGLIQESCYLVANKIDLTKRIVTKEEGLIVAQELGVNYIETSAKSGENVNQLFQQMAEIILQLVDQHRTIAHPPENKGPALNLQGDHVNKSECKC